MKIMLKQNDASQKAKGSNLCADKGFSRVISVTVFLYHRVINLRDFNVLDLSRVY